MDRADGSLAWFQTAQIADIERSLPPQVLVEFRGAGWEHQNRQDVRAGAPIILSKS